MVIFSPWHILCFSDLRAIFTYHINVLLQNVNSENPKSKNDQTRKIYDKKFQKVAPEVINSNLYGELSKIAKSIVH